MPVPKERLDELLLELILIDTVAKGDAHRGPAAERLIERVLSPASTHAFSTGTTSCRTTTTTKRAWSSSSFSARRLRTATGNPRCCAGLCTSSVGQPFVSGWPHRSAISCGGDGRPDGVPGSVQHHFGESIHTTGSSAGSGAASDRTRTVHREERGAGVLQVKPYCGLVLTIGCTPGPGTMIVGVVPSGVKMILSVALSALALARAVCSVDVRRTIRVQLALAISGARSALACSAAAFARACAISKSTLRGEQLVGLLRLDYCLLRLGTFCRSSSASVVCCRASS